MPSSKDTNTNEYCRVVDIVTVGCAAVGLKRPPAFPTAIKISNVDNRWHCARHLTILIITQYCKTASPLQNVTTGSILCGADDAAKPGELQKKKRGVQDLITNNLRGRPDCQPMSYSKALRFNPSSKSLECNRTPTSQFTIADLSPFPHPPLCRPAQQTFISSKVIVLPGPTSSPEDKKEIPINTSLPSHGQII